MAGAAHMHGEENGAESWNMFMAAFCAFVVAGNLLDFERKEGGYHEDDEAYDKHSNCERCIWVGDWNTHKNHCEEGGETEEA